MDPNIAAFLLIFKLCYGMTCKIEPYEPPCIVQVTTYMDVKVGTRSWTSTADKFVMIPNDRKIINICEVTDDDDRSDGYILDDPAELQQRPERGGNMYQNPMLGD